jgi:hypothetical protein
MASGSHKRWGEGPTATELHVYPRSRGRFLRHIGEALEKACELLVEHRASDLIKMLSNRCGRGANRRE